VRNRQPNEGVGVLHCDAILGRAFQTSQRIGKVCRTQIQRQWLINAAIGHVLICEFSMSGNATYQDLGRLGGADDCWQKDFSTAMRARDIS
jgi:hypothetical protein